MKSKVEAVIITCEQENFPDSLVILGAIKSKSKCVQPQSFPRLNSEAYSSRFRKPLL